MAQQSRSVQKRPDIYKTRRNKMHEQENNDKENKKRIGT